MDAATACELGFGFWSSGAVAVLGEMELKKSSGVMKLSPCFFTDAHI